MGGSYSSDPYGGGGSYSKDPYGDSSGGKTVSAAPKKSGGGGILGALKSVAKDVNPEKFVSGAAGLGQAAYDAGRVVVLGDKGVITGNQKEQQQASDTVGAYTKGVVKDYAKHYGALAHGHPGQFAKDVAHDPFSYLLDAASVATLGGAGAVKAGELLAKAGAISKESRLARLGEPTDITVPNFRGEKVAIKQSSPNPVVRARQNLVNNAMNALPADTPSIGRSARVVKAASRPAERAAAKIRIQAQPFQESFAKLNGPERAAWHLSARALDPQAYKALVLKSGEKASPAMLKLLDNPKVDALVKSPSPRLADAIGKGRALAEQMTGEKLRQGIINDQAAAEAPYRTLRLANGAKFNEEGDLVDRPGREIPVLAREIAAAGKEQPHYVPDSAVSSGTRGAGRFRSKPSGLGEPQLPGSSKQNLGVLASKGMLNFKEDALGREMGLLANRTEGATLHDELVKHAAELPKGTPLPAGYEYLKLNHGEATAPYTERIGGEFETHLDPGTPQKVLTTDGTSNEIATRNGNRLIVPAEVRKILEDKSLSYRGAAARLLYNQPTSVWKHLVLGLRPAFFGNITVGNSVLGALQMAPGFHGVGGWLNQVVPGAEKVLGTKLTAKQMAETFPEQVGGTFGHTMGFGGSAGSSKLARGASRAYQGVMPATIAYENVLRRAMAEGWAKATPEVQKAMRANGGDVNAALRAVAKSHPQIIDGISKRIDDALGNYRTYNKLERAIKQLVPFYGWDRHIVRSVARIVSERPALADALLNVGRVGQQRQEAQLGPLPSYMSGDVRLPGLPSFLGPLNGRVPVLNTQSLNPANTAVDLARIPEGLLGGPGTPGSQELVSGLNPIVAAALEQATGRNLLTGAAMKGNAFEQEVKGIPQVNALLTALGKKPKTKPTSLYQNDAQTTLANLLGFPVKKPLLQTAHLYAAEEKKPRRY